MSVLITVILWFLTGYPSSMEQRLNKGKLNQLIVQFAFTKHQRFKKEKEALKSTAAALSSFHLQDLRSTAAVRTSASAIKMHTECVSPAAEAVKHLPGLCFGFTLSRRSSSRRNMVQREKLRKLALVCCLLIEVRPFFNRTCVSFRVLGCYLEWSCSVTDLWPPVPGMWVTLFSSLVCFSGLWICWGLRTTSHSACGHLKRQDVWLLFAVALAFTLVWIWYYFIVVSCSARNACSNKNLWQIFPHPMFSWKNFAHTPVVQMDLLTCRPSWITACFRETESSAANHL